jgi:putative ABC transport system permease protein
MLLVAIGAIAAGTFGPIYLSETDHSVLLSTVRSAPEGNRGITLIPSRGRDPLERLLRASAAVTPAFGGPTYFGAPIITADLGVTTTATTDGQLYQSDLVARTGVCEHLQFASGGCPTSPSSVAVSTRSARALGLATGDHLTLSVARSRTPVSLTISGLFRPGNRQAGYWWGENFLAFGQGISAVAPLLDDFFADRATVLAASPPGQISVMAQRPLLTDALTPGTVGSFEHSLAELESRSTARDGVGVSSQIVPLLGQAAGDEHTAGTIVIVVDLQLVLLSLLVLYFVAARTADAREPDVRLAELRGFAPTDAAVVALLEPLAVLGVAVPVGIVAAWLAAVVATPHLFVDAVTPTIGPLAVGAGVLSFAAGVLATVLGARRLIFRRRAVRHGSGGPAIALAVDAVAIAIAGVAFVEVAAAGVSSGSHTDPLAAFAPGLLAFGVGVLAARLLPLACRWAIALTRHSRRVGTALAVRRLGRRAELSRHVVLVSLAVGLAVFAVAGWTVARRNQSIRAGFDVGASRALLVQVPPGVDFLSAVRRADPGGTKAMAVVIERAPDGVVLAVDSNRLAAVSSWPSTLSPRGVRSIGRLLAPPTAPAVTVSGALRLTVDVNDDGGTPPGSAPELQAVVVDDSFQTLSTVDLGPLQVADHVYQASLAGDCTPSCRLVNLAVTWTPPSNDPEQTITVGLAVAQIEDQPHGGPWSVVRADLDTSRDWEGNSGVSIGSERSALSVAATVNADGAPETFGPADVPTPLPAVVTGPGATAVGLDGATIAVRPVVTVSALPVIGNDNGAAMVDLPDVERLQSGPMIDVTPEVWLAPGPDQQIISRLGGDGITVVGVRSLAATVTALSKSGVSLAFALFLLAAIVAGLLAVGSTIFTVSVTARRRIVELASLRAVGIETKTLRRSLALEQVLVLGVGVIAGAVAGLIATAVALPSIPEDFAVGPAPALDFGLPLAAIGLILLATIISLGITVAVAARLVVGRASVDKLGGEQ